ncbi:reverse transcriptase-like protein, partial [Vibrio vulnificus]|uniref:reverse transcriptase-like protein n=1 Tax=Vibrio vulnificus TaxID=672 RepID=UPI0019D48F47
ELNFSCTNNQAEYEAHIIGLEILKELKARYIKILRDSQMVLKQMSGEYRCSSFCFAHYFAAAIQMLGDFEEVELEHVPKSQN